MTATCTHDHLQPGCPGCRARKTREQRLRRAGLLPGLVGAHRARAQVAGLLAAGLSVHEVARLAGVTTDTVRRLRGGGFATAGLTMRVATEASVLAARLPREHRYRRVSAAGFLRRYEAMVLRGWSAAAMAAVLQEMPATVRQWTSRARSAGTVRAYQAAAMGALYVLTYGQPGPGGGHPARARGRAAVGDTWTPASIDGPGQAPPGR